MIGLSFTASAQTDLLSQYSKTIDTVTNTGTKYLTIPTPYNVSYKTWEVAVSYTKISGTVGGTATVEYSIDGSNFYSLKRDSVYTATDVAGQTLGWRIVDPGAKYIRVKATGTGTMSAQIKAKVYGRQ